MGWMATGLFINIDFTNFFNQVYAIGFVMRVKKAEKKRNRMLLHNQGFSVTALHS